MESNEVTIEKLLNEYDKYVMSRLINKEYDFNNLRQMVKLFSEETEMIEYKEEQTNKEVVENIRNFIREKTYGKKFDIE